MKTITTLSALKEDNDFKIQNYTDYVLIEVTAAVEGSKDAVTMSFPWATSIPYMDVSVQDAIKKCEETAKKSLEMHLEAKKKKEDAMPWHHKFYLFARREIEYFYSKTKISVDKQNDIC